MAYRWELDQPPAWSRLLRSRIFLLVGNGASRTGEVGDHQKYPRSLGWCHWWAAARGPCLLASATRRQSGPSSMPVPALQNVGSDSVIDSKPNHRKLFVLCICHPAIITTGATVQVKGWLLFGKLWSLTYQPARNLASTSSMSGKVSSINKIKEMQIFQTRKLPLTSLSYQDWPTVDAATGSESRRLLWRHQSQDLDLPFNPRFIQHTWDSWKIPKLLTGAAS